MKTWNLWTPTLYTEATNLAGSYCETGRLVTFCFGAHLRWVDELTAALPLRRDPDVVEYAHGILVEDEGMTMVNVEFLEEDERRFTSQVAIFPLSRVRKGRRVQLQIMGAYRSAERGVRPAPSVSDRLRALADDLDRR